MEICIMPLITGTSGNDSLTGSTVADDIYGYSGSDTINGNGGDDLIVGGAGADLISGGSGNDTIYGDDFQSVNQLTDGADTIYGNDGDDVIYTGLARDTVYGGAGNDQIYINAFGTDANGSIRDVIYGEDGNDIFYVPTANPTVNQFNGGQGFDVIVGVDDLWFNAVLSTFQLEQIESASASPLRINGMPIAGNNLDFTGIEFVNIQGIYGDGQDTVFANGGADTITGTISDDRIYGEGGNDSLMGGDGNDTLGGGASTAAPYQTQTNDGADTLNGGAGSDTALYFQPRSSMTIAGTAGNFTITIGGVTDTLQSIEFVDINGAIYDYAQLQSGIILPSPGADTLVGTAGNDSINGLGGNDLISGIDGADTLDGGAGNDTLTGGADDDTFIFTSGFDVVTDFTAGGTEDRLDFRNIAPVSDLLKAQGLASQAGADTILTLGFNNVVTLKNVTATALTAADFTLAVAAPNNPMNGTSGPDTITGTAGVDSISGGTGNDTLGGYGGNDTLVAGDGQDYLYGGIGNDLLDGGNDFDALTGEDGNDTLMAGTGDDYLYGGTGDNVMAGGDGVDAFISEGSADIMNGGAGRGYFYRYAAGASQSFGGGDIDEFVGGAFASNDTVYGFDGADYLYGGDGNDELIGGAGNDVILGQNGNDTIDGGSGTNTLWCNDIGNDQVRVNVADAGNQVIEFFQAGGTDDTIRLIGSTMTSFADYQALLNNLGTNINGNALYDTGGGLQLYLNLGVNQTAVWVMGVSAYNMTAADFTFG
jgi:Ca2+-binding RTX toxin-like protein